jgi:hypothetical protein
LKCAYSQCRPVNWLLQSDLGKRDDV